MCSKPGAGPTSSLGHSVVAVVSRPRPQTTIGTRQYSIFQDASDSEYPKFTAALTTVVTGILLYQTYDNFTNKFTAWPEELKGDLRFAALGRDIDHPEKSVIFYHQALEKARKLTPEKLGGEYNLKLSGIGIALGAALEKQNDQYGAYHMYAGAFEDLTREPPPSTRAHALSLPESVRAIGLLMKLSELAPRFGQREAEERYLSFAAQELQKVGLKERTTAGTRRPEALKVRVPKHDLSLPIWAFSIMPDRLNDFRSKHAARLNTASVEPAFGLR